MPLLTTALGLLGAASAFAAPVDDKKRGFDQVISQCNRGFAYTWDDGPSIYNTDLVNKFSSRGGRTTFCEYYFNPWSLSGLSLVLGSHFLASVQPSAYIDSPFSVVNGDTGSCIYEDANVQRLRYAYENGMQIGTFSQADHTILSLIIRSQPLTLGVMPISRRLPMIRSTTKFNASMRRL
jgi:hypothetical protein